MRKLISYGRQKINQLDKEIVYKSLGKDLITTGSFVKLFESKLKKYFNSKFVLSCSSGTAAIHIALKAIDVKKGDVIIMPSINFISAYNICKLIGAQIYLSDIDPSTGQMTPKNIYDCIKLNKIKKVKVILTMYLGGYPRNITQLNKIKKKLGCFLIEDACHAMGSSYKFQNKKYKVGSCKHADISTFSLHPLKTITSGEGGIVTMNSKKLYQNCLLFRSHGIVRNLNKHWEYDIKSEGLNYRLSDINSALAYSQLKRINSFIRNRKKIFLFYKKEIQKLKNINLILHDKNIFPSYHLVLTKFKKINENINTKNKILKFLLDRGVMCQYHYIPIYKFSSYKKKENLNDFKGTEEYYFNTFSLPIYVDLKLKNLKKIINLMKKFDNDHL